MARRQQWIMWALVFACVWGMSPGSAVSDEADMAGKAVYEKHCRFCHGEDGMGNPKMAKLLKVTIPPVTAAALAQQDEAEMLHIIAEGKGKMPAFASKLSEEEQQQVFEYMQTLDQH
jgi:mono/diheme cytochrome c family protein